MKDSEKIKYIVQTYLYFVRRATATQIAAFLNEGPFQLNDGVSSKQIIKLLKGSDLFDKRMINHTWTFMLAGGKYDTYQK